jgi:diaminohydroxyphosphoribosylaminopyrimidine deaminase/5-amino-6-(5-phosphoribosylamino)uracil reductase
MISVMRFSKQDELFMRQALALARRGVGKTSPNPAVGAVIVRGGKIIGEGWHKRAGEAHAEILALRAASRETTASGTLAPPTKRPSGATVPVAVATLYVTLEPCCTQGRTPPCTDAIIAAGIKRVVVAATDPNPKHRGRGLRLLRKAGTRVDAGLLADEATQLNRPFNKWITTGLPWVIAKAALSLDGKMATHTGDSKWITSDAARRAAHRLRAQVDAIMVGANTVIRDDPRLTLRHGVRGRQPWRVVLDGWGRSPLRVRIFTDSHRHRTIVVTTRRSSARWRQYLALRDITVLVLPEMNERVKLGTALRELGRLEITSVLVEGGAEVLGSLFDAGLADAVAFFFAPVVIAGHARVRDAVRVRGQWRRIGHDEIVFEG